MSVKRGSAETAAPFPMLAIYADESCLGNGREGDNPGGAAGVIEYWNPATERLTRFDYWIADLPDTRALATASHSIAANPFSYASIGIAIRTL